MRTPFNVSTSDCAGVSVDVENLFKAFDCRTCHLGHGLLNDAGHRKK
jgi:hypothetical protein